MQEILNQLKAIPSEEFNYKSVGHVLYNADISSIDIERHLPKPIENGYSRKIVDLEPIECLVLNWAPGAESAVHYHKGFWGYVVVAKGICSNVEYEMDGDFLKESLITTVHDGGVLPEPDDIIHKIMNGSKTEPLITIHFYYPALTDLNGLKIYDLESEKIGVLNSLAASASWAEPEEHFDSITPNAFKYIEDADNDSPSHIIRPLIPKPSSKEITSMLSEYYDDQAKTYDYMDRAYESRKKYVDCINIRIANYLVQNQPNIKSMLALACGTGRRATEIRNHSKLNYSIQGLDVSTNMCEMASERDLDIVHADWAEFDKKLEGSYDAATILYAFGHIPSKSERINILSRLKSLLAPGAPVFLDLFNINDKYEWGNTIQQLHQDLKLEQFGYEIGDVFYSRNRHNKLAYLHYFTDESIREVIEKAGMEIIDSYHIGYAYNPGEKVNRDSGNIFVVAKAKD